MKTVTPRVSALAGCYNEASRGCVWLRDVIQHIRGSCGIISDKEPPTVLHEDNAACIAQLKEGYMKGDRTKHILLKFFFTHDLQKSGDISIQQVRSCENLADLFTKSLPNSTFQRLDQDQETNESVLQSTDPIH
ncbi:hypothetical protein OSB04_028921 [Centaurea solstitialis]|uniref:Uncharacterized protein n=1 Tax=Centaurea solstitialis TaxID=347529 RepID=A0AA38SGR9_9ASTR|nr:hypothetical protein OSB04_028921 [Centaurea solstitialis]